jgi:hypothetical protein
VSGSWDSSATEWLNESSDTLTDNDRHSSFYISNSYRIGLVYMTKASSPYNIKFSFIVVGAVERPRRIINGRPYKASRIVRTMLQRGS